MASCLSIACTRTTRLNTANGASGDPAFRRTLGGQGGGAEGPGDRLGQGNQLARHRDPRSARRPPDGRLSRRARDVVERAGISDMLISISHCRSHATAYALASGPADDHSAEPRRRNPMMPRLTTAAAEPRPMRTPVQRTRVPRVRVPRGAGKSRSEQPRAQSGTAPCAGLRIIREHRLGPIWMMKSCSACGSATWICRSRERRWKAASKSSTRS